MEQLVVIGRLFFAAAFIGLGVEHFIFREFVSGRAPAWPAAIPGRVIWAYLTGAVFISASIAVIIGKKARQALVLAGALILVWALLRHLPVVAADSLFASTWTRAGKALVFVGGAWALAGTLPKADGEQRSALVRFVNLEREFILVGRICLATFLLITGIQHFLHTPFVASLIPGWFPGDPVFWTYFAGVALLAGGLGLLISWTAPLAALLAGTMVFSWFWIIHIPRTFLSVSDGIAVFEALAVSGIAFGIGGFMSAERRRARRAPHDVR